MPDNPIGSLYPGGGNYPTPGAPGAPGAGPGGSLLSNPLGLINLGAQQALGRASINALNPDGSFNPAAYTSALQGSPIAAFAGVQGPEAALVMRGQNIANARNQFVLDSSQYDYALNQISSLAANPATTKNDVYGMIVNLARQTSIPTQRLTSLVAGAPDDPGALHNWLGELGNAAQGYAASTGRIAGPPTASGAPTTIPQGTAIFGQNGQVPIDNPPGTAQGAQLMQGDLARAGNYAQEIYPWQQALKNIQELGPGGVGPGSAGRQQVESFLYSLMPSISSWLPGVDPSKLKNYDELNKYLTQATQARANSFGAHTDMQLATAISGNPSVHINDLAATDVIKASIALKRMEVAQTLESAKGGPVLYPYEKANWAVNQDPRAFAIDMMPPAQVQNLQKTLKGAERTRFNASLQSVINSGMISPPGQ